MTTTIQNLAVRQTMLCFSFLAYTGEEITTANPEATILNNINQTMQGMPTLCAPNSTTPQWAVVWGPAVYTTPGALYQDNLIFIAQSTVDPTQVVLAIRGTNFVAQLDWLMDDLDILQQMPWPPAPATPIPGAMISESTSITLQLLLSLTDSTSGQTALQCLQTLSATPIEICVTGHSLGGCMAGTLAYYLDINHSAWDASGTSLVSCVTFAGPTAGNTAFAAASDNQFATGSTFPKGWDSTLGTRCDAVRCNLDIAPQAWIAANFLDGSEDSPIFNTYGSDIDFDNLPFIAREEWKYGMLNLALPEVAKVLTPGSYAQVVASATQLTGTFNGTPPPTKDSTLLVYLQAFAEQAAWQHGNGYPNALGLSGLYNQIIRNTSASSSTGVRQRSRMAVRLGAKLC